jgi:hypothetical protein
MPTERPWRRNLVPTFVDRGLSRGQRGGSSTVVNFSFLGLWPAGSPDEDRFPAE